MKILKNTESTAIERLRIVIGTLVALSGVATIGYIFVTGSTGFIEWVIGFGLIILGIVISGSHRIATFIADLIR